MCRCADAVPLVLLFPCSLVVTRPSCPPQVPLVLPIFISLVLPKWQARPPYNSATQPLSHSITQSLIQSVAHPQLASSGPEPIVLDSMALVDQTPSIYCPQQRVECAPQTRAMPCFVTGNRNFGSSPEEVLYTVFVYYIRDWMVIYRFMDG